VSMAAAILCVKNLTQPGTIAVRQILAQASLKKRNCQLDPLGRIEGSSHLA
jgi:hypothetical protein